MTTDNKALVDRLTGLAEAHEVDARTLPVEWKREIARITATVLREAAAALTANPSAQAGEGWRPIETAPTRKAVLVIGGDVARVDIAENAPGRFNPGETPANAPAEWYLTTSRGTGRIWPHPTHWMPLPTAPVRTQDCRCYSADAGNCIGTDDLAGLDCPCNCHDRACPPQPQGDASPEEMSPEFTDSARGALAWVLYHHQGGSSPVGQPIRFALGMGAHDPLGDCRIAEAKRWAESTGRSTSDFHASRQVSGGGEVLEIVAKYVGRTSNIYRYIRDDIAALSTPQARSETALRDALEYVGQRSDGDLNTLAERAELWMRESKVLIDQRREQARPDACPACHKAWGEHRSGYSASRCQMKPAPTVDGGAYCYEVKWPDGVTTYPSNLPPVITKGAKVTALYTHPAPAPDVARLVEAAKGLRAAYLKRAGCYPLPASDGYAAMQAMDRALAPFTAAQQEKK